MVYEVVIFFLGKKLENQLLFNFLKERAHTHREREKEVLVLRMACVLLDQLRADPSVSPIIFENNLRIFES